jgi:NifU-like protein involved in Fe-S cluster formation
MEKTKEEILEVEKSINEATKIAHKFLKMLEEDGKIPRRALISILMILHAMLEKEDKLVDLDKQTMLCLHSFGITVEEAENGN